MPSGTALTTFSVGITQSWKDRDSGEQKERTEWMRCETWGKLAEICSEYLRKGSQVYVEGELRTDKYEQDGVTKYSTKVRVNDMVMLGKGRDRDNRSGRQEPTSPPKQDEFDDEIPF